MQIESMMGIAYLFLFLDIVFYFIIGIYLLIRSKQLKKYNLTYLAMEMITLGTFFIISAIATRIPSMHDQLLMVAYTFSIVRSFFCLVFIQKTFHHKNKNVFMLLFSIGIVVLSILYVLSVIIVDLIYYLGSICFSSYSIITYIWLTRIVFKEYKQVKTFDIETHVKKRYYILGITSIASITVLVMMIITMSFQELPLVNLAYYSYIVSINVIFFIITSLVSIARTGLNFLVWVMPKPFKSFLNKGYTPSDDGKQISEEEIMKQMVK